MMRIAAPLLPLCFMAVTADAQADLSLIGHSELSALNRPNRSQEALYIKKDRLRRDLIEGGRRYSYLYDLKRRQLTLVDHLQRQVEVRALEDDGRRKAADRELKLDLTPTGRTHELRHWECLQHELSASLPGSIGQEQVTVSVTGQVWLAPNAREQRAVQPFIKAIPAQELFVGVPVQGGAATPQVQGVNEVLRRILPKGMLCAAQLQIDYQGGGPMANLARRMATRLALVYEDLSDDPLKDELFEPPEGYQVVRPRTTTAP